MNMISTGAFLNEMDASNKQPTVAEKFAAVWEKKNAKAARAGGVSLMALSLAACGGSSSTTSTDTTDTSTDTTTTTPVVAGKTLELTDSTTADTLVGGDGDDTFTGASGAYADTDSMIDGSTTDADTATFITKAAANPTIKNVETLNVTAESTATAALDLSKVTGATTLNFSKGDVVIGGSTITASSVVELDNVDSASLSTINVTGTVTTVDLDSASDDKAGIVLNAETATGSVSVDGAATINANASTGTVSINAVSNTAATETVKASVINAAKATTVTTHADLAGSIEINAAAATTVTVADAQGGVVINAAKGAKSSDGIDVRGIDASGATITTGSYASTAAGTIDLAGTSGATDVANISGAGYINLDVGVSGAAVDTVNLTANDAAVTYTVSASTGGFTTMTIGADATAKGDEAVFAGKTVTGAGTLDLSAGTADAVDLSGVDVGKIKIGFDNQNTPVSGTTPDDHPFTIKSGQTVELYADQTDIAFNFAGTETSADLKIIAGDDNGSTNTAVGTITTGVLSADSTLAGTVTIEAIEANLTATTSSTFGAKQTVVITGDEDVDLKTVTAKAVDASASTGKIGLTATSGLKTITTGSGVDTIVLNHATTKHTLATGDGKDDITITATDDESSIDAGAGNDTINANEEGKSYVVAAGDGDDTVTTTGYSSYAAVLAGGDGTDTFDVNSGGNAMDVSATTFRLVGFEKLDLAGHTETMTVSATQFADFNDVEVIGDGADDILQVNAAATGSTIDASGLTVKSTSTVTLKYKGGAKADVITGSTAAEEFIFSLGADSIAAGATGTDTLTFGADTTLAITGSDNSTGVVINLSGSAVSDAAVYAGVSKYTGNSVDVAAGTVAHVFDANKTTNSVEVTSIDGIEDVVAGDGADYIEGSAVANDLNGGGGNDYIDGNDGDDTITGGTGADTMTGGNGADLFKILATSSTGTAYDVIKDFTISEDKIDFAVGSTLHVADVADVDVASNAGNGTDGDVHADIVDGFLTLSAGDGGASADVAAFDTLLEVLNAVEEAVIAAEVGGADDHDVLVGFQFDGNTYIAEYDYTDGNDTTDTASLTNLVQLEGVTGITDLDTSAAANTVVIA